MTWIPFDPTKPPPKGDYWCEVSALQLRDGGCLCRALYWTGERWEGPGGEYEVGRFVPEMLPQLHGRGDDASERTSSSAIDDTIEHLLGDISALSESIAEDEARAKARELRLKVCRVRANALHHMSKDWRDVAQKMTDDGDDWNLDAAIARISELESDRSAMALRIERLTAELAKPEDQRLRDVLDALEGRAVIFDGLGARVGHLLDEMDEWIARAGEAERMVEAARRSLSSVAEAMTEHAYQELASALESPPRIAVVVPVEVHEHGWQCRPTATDTAFAPPFGTIRQCRVCGCLVACGPTACASCAEAGS